MGKVKTGSYNPLPIVPIVLVGANVNGKPNYMPIGFVKFLHRIGLLGILVSMYVAYEVRLMQRRLIKKHSSLLK